MSVGAANKYGNKRTEIDGITFASRLEARRYGELKLLQQAGEIRDLEVHPRYELRLAGVRIGHYTGDFRFVDVTGHIVVEDVKSPASKTEAYGLRKKLMKAIYNIDIVDVTA